MPKQKPLPRKAVIPKCSCGSEVYGCIPLITVGGYIAKEWYQFQCVKCGSKITDKVKIKAQKEPDGV